MTRLHHFGRSAAALTALAVLAACSSDNNRVLGPTPVDSMFRSYVSLGNSITSGYQSGGIMDSTQKRAYPVLMAQQMRTRFAYPSLQLRGCAPPIINFLTQQRYTIAALGTSTSTTCDGRSANATATINNVGVPGAAVRDLTTATTTPETNVLTSLFLSGESQVQKALDNNPTFASIWIGNNDVLAAALSGIVVPYPGVSPGITPVDTFTKYFDAALDQLTAGAPNLHGLLIGVVQVAGAPALFPVDSLINDATFRAIFNAATGQNPSSGDPYKAAPIQFDPNCAPPTNTLVSMLIVGQIAAFRNDTNPTGDPPKNPATRAGHPPYIACGPTGLQPSPVGQIFILDDTDLAALQGAVAAYNAHIQAKATALGWAYVDPNPTLAALRGAGAIPAIPDLTSATAPFGAYFTLDGVHPSNTAHKALANLFIAAINAQYGTTLETIP